MDETLRACLRTPRAGKALGHQMDHRDIDKGCTGLGQRFEVAAQPAMARQPGESAFDPPTLGQDLKADLAAELLDNLQRPAEAGLDGGNPLLPVAAIGPDSLQHRD